MDPRQAPWDCDAARQALPLYVGGDLPTTAMDGLARHMRACRTCSALEARAVRARGVLVQGLQARASAPMPDLLAGLRTKLQPAAAAGQASTALDEVELGRGLESLERESFEGQSLEADVDARRGRLLAFPARVRRLALVGAAAAAALAMWGLSAREEVSGDGLDRGPAVAESARAADAGRPTAEHRDESLAAAAREAFPPLVAPGDTIASQPALGGVAPSPRQPSPVALLGVAADDDALRPLRTSETPLRHAAVRTVEVPWIEGNPGRVLTPGGSLSTVGFGGLPR